MASAERNDEAPNSAPLGAMGSLLRRLDMVPCTDDGGSISELKDHIHSISDKLKKLSEVQDPPLTVNYWMKHARELSYDIEAYLDDIDAQTEDGLNDSDAKEGDDPDDSYAKMKDSIDNSDDDTEYSVDDSHAEMEDNPDDSDANMDDSIDNSDDEMEETVDNSDSSMQDSICSSDYKISGFRTRAEGMIERHKRFSLDSVLSCPTAATTIVRPRPSRDAVLVGMGSQITKLISLLRPKDENDNQLKIVSILGDEGIGKSTVIQEIWRVSFKEKEIWHELESEVNIKRAFVRMGKKPDVRMILRSILSQVSQQEPDKDSGVTNLIRDIRKHLEQKRYFIIVDDVRSVSIWDVVGRAFPRCSVGSRIITTTSDKEVALACCSYILAHSEGDCKELFNRTVDFGSVNLQLSEQVLDEIIRKCGGLPLAIIWTAILVASKLETEQGLSRTEKEQNLDSDVKKFLDENLRTGSTPVEILNQVLKLCYSSLPHYLKTCLLYLSVYPENYLFLKEDLVKLWIAEDFICTSKEDKVEAAGRYFDVLVNLGLIQRMDINCSKQHHQGEVEDEEEEYPLRVPYVVHPTVFDFITSKSTEDNFITVIDYSQLTIAFKEKIRRLSLHFGSATYASTPESIGLSHVRTLSFMGLLSCTPSLVEFKLVRVLILHLWADDGDKKFPLAEICRLLLLRYLQVRCNVTVELPGQISCLKHLETLEINSVVTAVPSDVFHLSRLLHLRLGLKQNLTLGHAAAVNAISSDKLLPPMDDSNSTSTPSVQIFELLLPICIFSRLPKWIPQLRKLSILEIVVRELLTTDIDMLADLPELTALSLYVRIPTARNIVFRRGAFPALKYFRFMCGVLSLEFQKEAVPNLRRLNIGFNVHTTVHRYDNILVGIQHLLKIQEVVAIIGASTGVAETDRIAAESALEDAITNKHPRPPMFNVKRVHLVEQDEVPVSIHGFQTEGSTTEQHINLVTAKDTHEHADSSFASVLWNTNMGDRNVDYNVLERILAGSEEPRHLPLEILTSITDNFSEDRKIGSGGFSDVYQGVLHHWSVAVKRIRVGIYTMDEKLFNREVQSLLKIIEHPNVVRFLGFCSNTYLELKESTGAEKRRLVEIRERLLCFEYISSGSLEKYITDELRGLEWNIRYQIIKGICEGLQYLHNEMDIIHMDLKPANIMVDTDDMVPKITDFGLVRLVQNKYTTGVRFCSRGYCAPEYINIGKTTLECDIYSLGIIIKEIVTGRNEVPNKDRVIRRWRCRWGKSATNTPLHVQQITKCIEIAERCMQKEPESRPSISHIIRDLDDANTYVNISAINQVSPSWWDDDDMLGIEPLELRFASEVNKEISNAVELSNNTGNRIAFNISTVSRLQYCTEPKKGIVPPRSKSTVKITLQAQGITTLGSMPRDDEIIVQSTKVEGDLTVEEINEDMFNDEVGKVVDEVILTVVYDDKPEKAQDDQPPVSVDIKLRGQGRTKMQCLNFRPPLHISTSTNMNDMAFETGTVISAMTGAMGSLRPKLLELLKAEHNLDTSVKKDVKSLERQLMNMHADLYKLSQAQQDQLGPKDTEWAKDVRGLSYEIEDIVDDLMVHMDRSESFTSSQDFLKGITDIMDRVKEVSQWHNKYKVPDFVVTPAISSTVDSQTAWYKDHRELVGIDGPRDELVKRLTGWGDETNRLKIISIFGEGGLGKTTLAKSVFNRLTERFLLKAFVPVGRNPDMKRVLKNILIELDKNNDGQILNQDWDQRQLTDKIRNVLENKRYFIVIDDIWDTKSWEIIKCALIENDNGSRVMTTSRNYAVAEISGEVCELKPLSHDQSRQLFNSRLTNKSTSTFDQPDEQSTEFILEKCGGLPLAIITIASLLDGKRVEDWPKVYNSIKFGHEDNKAEITKKILMFSYFDLPCHLKTCLLYLSIYPEDHVIGKNTLVWRWIAEGFVRQEKGKTLFEVGEGYFSELINRSIIQPEEHIPHLWYFDTIETGSICACRVHDMVLDLICSMAKEENFVTVLDNDEQHLSSQNNARILAVHKRSLEQLDLANTCKQVMRSFNSSSTGCDLSRRGLNSLLTGFRVLRVLSLEYLSAGGAYRLKNVAQLCQLRYLGLAGTSIRELPMEIGDLRCLQILDLMDTEIPVLPQSVTQLRDLKCLLCYSPLQPVTLPDGMGSLASLEELRLFLEEDRLTKLDDVVEELGTLTELRVLQIKTGGFSDRLNKALVESVNKLKKMEELDIHGYGKRNEFMEADDDPTRINIWDDYSPSQLLRHLGLWSIKMPVWIDVTSLRNVSYLKLRVTSFTPSDLGHLGSLPELRSLVLLCDDGFHGVVAAADGDAFPKLRYFKTSCSLRYVQGAMRCLESLRLELMARLMARPDVEFDFDSIQCLHSLVKVSARFDHLGSTTAREEAEVVRAALRRAVYNHPNRPILEF